MVQLAARCFHRLCRADAARQQVIVNDHLTRQDKELLHVELERVRLRITGRLRAVELVNDGAISGPWTEEVAVRVVARVIQAPDRLWASDFLQNLLRVHSVYNLWEALPLPTDKGCTCQLRSPTRLES